MIRRSISVCTFTLVLTIAVACTKKQPARQVVVEIPAGFNGYFVLDMGVREAPPLPKDGSAYLLTVPRNGKAQTSTVIDDPEVSFKNGSNGQVWGYSHKLFTTGDGIPVGGKIEFFVGTQKEFEAEQNKKNKSDGFFNNESAMAGA